MNVVQLHPIAPLSPSEFTIERWLSVRDVILPAIERLGGTHSETDIVAMLLARQLHLWVVGKSAFLTEFAQYPRVKRLSVFAAGGDMNEIMSAKDALEHFAKANGCQQTRIEGRKGWERKHQDYRFLSMSMIKEV